MDLRMYVLLVAMCSKERMGVFIRLGSMNAIFISAVIIAMIILCLYEIAETDYTVGNMAAAKQTNWTIGSERVIILVNANVGPLMGIMCTAHYLHSCSIPILRNAREP